jgi:rhodanese-related sulfurtransferase
MATPAARKDAAEYVTWKGIGPDKWASAWLIHRHIDPGATIRFIETGRQPASGVAFDIPDLPPYVRDSQRTTYENLLSGYRVENALLIRIGAIVHDVEVNFWGGEQSPASPFVEHAFRGLQLKYGRENVPRACYFQLFDALYDYMQTSKGDIAGAALERALQQDPRCGSLATTTTGEDRKYVAEWRPGEILGFIGAGDRVVFVDTRESDEFREGHIPGAVNIRLRDIGRVIPPGLEHADVVIPYCVKDFRGFEVAKRLKQLGVKNVGLMNPWGISGWKKTGLPVAGMRGFTEQEAVRKLDICVNQPAACVNGV